MELLFEMCLRIFEKDADNVGKQKEEEQAFKMDRPFVTPCLLNQTKQ